MLFKLNSFSHAFSSIKSFFFQCINVNGRSGALFVGHFNSSHSINFTLIVVTFLSHLIYDWETKLKLCNHLEFDWKHDFLMRTIKNCIETIDGYHNFYVFNLDFFFQFFHFFRWFCVRTNYNMDVKSKKNHFVHVPVVEETEDSKSLNDGSENGGDTVPLGLTGRAVCMQVFI